MRIFQTQFIRMFTITVKHRYTLVSFLQPNFGTSISSHSRCVIYYAHLETTDGTHTKVHFLFLIISNIIIIVFQL